MIDWRTYIPRSNEDLATRVHKLRLLVQIESWAMLTLVLVTVAAYFTHEQPIYYFAALEKSEPKPLMAMMAPNHTDQAVASWIGSAAADILNFGFHNVEQRLSENKKYFTSAGWRSFAKSIERSKLIERIAEKQQVVTAAPVGAPVIIDRKENGILGTEWTLQIPFTVTVLSGKLTQTQKRILTVIITQVPPSHNLSGLGIDNWVESL